MGQTTETTMGRTEKKGTGCCFSSKRSFCLHDPPRGKTARMVYSPAVAASVEEAILAGDSLVSVVGEKREVAGAGVAGAGAGAAVVAVQSGRRRQWFRHDIHPWSTSRTLRSQTPRCECCGIRVNKFFLLWTINPSPYRVVYVIYRCVGSTFGPTTTLQDL